MKRPALALTFLFLASAPALAQKQDPDVAAYLQSVGSHDPITARMTSKIKLTFGPMAKVVDAQDLPIVGKRSVQGSTFYVVSFGPGGLRVLVNDKGEVFSLPKDESAPLEKPGNLKPKDALIVPIPR